MMKETAASAYVEPRDTAMLHFVSSTEPLRHLCGTSAEPLQNLCGTSTEPLWHLYGTYAEPLRVSAGNVA